MSHNNDTIVGHLASHELYQSNLENAKQLLKDYFEGRSSAIEQFKENHPFGKQADFTPNLQDAHLLIAGKNVRIKKLSLEKLKKEAKDLLRAIKSQSPTAITRIKNNHPRGENCQLYTIKLADAQSIIARENGLSSWAKLKHHFNIIELAQTHLKSPHLTLDHDMKTLHIRCGDDIRKAIEDSGFSGDFLEITNPFSQGPVPHFEPLDEFIETRAQFVLENYAPDIPKEFGDRAQNSATEFREIEKQLRQLPNDYRRITVWFEHDPFDQLCLAYILAHLSNQNLNGCKVELIQASKFPGIKKFVSIGYLGEYPEGLIMLWQQRVTVTPAMIAFGTRCWDAFTSKTPHEIYQLTQEKSPLPVLQSALIRTLQELPWKGNGLSLTEHLTLEIVKRESQINLAKTFHFLNTEIEPMPYLGNIMFLAIAKNLWKYDVNALDIVSTDESEPAMSRETLVINELGNKLLKNNANWLEVCDKKYQRWIGNTRISPNKKNWYWCDKTKQPIFK